MKQNSVPSPSLNNGLKRRIRKSEKVDNIDNTLNYLRESLSNYMDNDMCQQLVQRIGSDKYADEEQFVRDLSEEEMAYLNDVLETELNYAKNVDNDVRVKELNEVYELLF